MVVLIQLQYSINLVGNNDKRIQIFKPTVSEDIFRLQ